MIHMDRVPHHEMYTRAVEPAAFHEQVKLQKS